MVPARPCTRASRPLRLVRTAAPAFLLVLVLMGGTVEASGCDSWSGEIYVPQARVTPARIGPLTSFMSEDGTVKDTVQGTYFYIVEFAMVDHEQTVFTLNGGADVHACASVPASDSLPVSVNSADFDVTFYDADGHKRGSSFDACGDESGIVPIFSSLAVVWLTAGSVPGSTFTLTTCG